MSVSKLNPFEYIALGFGIAVLLLGILIFFVWTCNFGSPFIGLVGGIIMFCYLITIVWICNKKYKIGKYTLLLLVIASCLIAIATFIFLSIYRMNGRYVCYYNPYLSIVIFAMISQNDYNDLIPLDYDMDGDGKINAYSDDDLIVNSASPYYIERLAIAANNDMNLERDSTGKFVNGGDIDDDGSDNFWDDDKDADGMSDYYESNYGMNPYGVSGGGGWQNPFVYNARYAVLVGGGDTDSSKNFRCFWIDTKRMYEVLANQYNYLDENIYLHFWDHQKGYEDGIYIDGPAQWYVYPIYQNEWGMGINNSLSEVRSKITKNDFFYLLATSHGGMSEEKGTGNFQTYDLITGTNSFVWYNYPGQDNSFAQNVDNLNYARIVIVFNACGSGTAIHGTDCCPERNLKEEDRIIITSSDKNEYSWCWAGDPLITADDYVHAEFFWNEDEWPWHGPDGFIYKYKTSDKISIKSAFDSGYNAARDDDWEISGCDNSTPQLYEWTSGRASYTYL